MAQCVDGSDGEVFKYGQVGEINKRTDANSLGSFDYISESE